ncbi:MAG TPA: BatA domain-containing protein [Steroidobacteraceae bacterium]|nr:BatA domain-containing protein [Steroidobacteraceae bacterium]
MWLAPWFLLGLAGLALPVWLHRFARKTDQKLPFASAMFLEPAEIRRSRRHELRYWLLLALRLLLLALLVLAFAGPMWRSVVARGAGGATLHVIVLDTSLSMQREGVWDRAQERALELVNGVRGGSRAMLVAADHRQRILVEPVFASDAGKLRAAVQGLKPGASRLDFGALVAGSIAWGGGPGETVQVHLISDLQQSASPLRFADLSPPAGVQLVLEDVGDAAGAANARVAGVQEDARTPGTVDVRLEGSADALKDRSLVVEVNGQERERRKLAAGPPQRTERVVLGELPLGEHRLTARLEPADTLPTDDAWYNLLRRVEPRVLVVAADVEGDDARYFGAALQALARPRFAVEIVQPGALATRQLGDFAAIVVSDAGLLNSAASQALEKYVQAGGAALMTLGPRAAQQRTVPVSGAKLAGGAARRAADSPARIAGLEQSHAVLREPGAWLRIRFFRHVAVETPENARVLLSFDNGTPLMLEQNLGTGRLLLFASPLDRQWNDLAIHPLFVRFVAEATAWLANARFDAASATVGSPLDATSLRRGGGQVFDPRGERSTMLGGGEESLRFIPELAGFYEVRGGGRSDFIAVNTDPRESMLVPLDEAARERWLALQRPAGADAGPTGSASATERLVPIWFWLLLAATLLAFMEPLVANYHLGVRREA